MVARLVQTFDIFLHNERHQINLKNTYNIKNTKVLRCNDANLSGDFRRLSAWNPAGFYPLFNFSFQFLRVTSSNLVNARFIYIKYESRHGCYVLTAGSRSAFIDIDYIKTLRLLIFAKATKLKVYLLRKLLADIYCLAAQKTVRFAGTVRT